ncbi:MAG: hypothetical protein GF398_02085 [Chitinivibrionales bacterium]|nr:hypothetical protein [Chitinivibrionales bacterium]
MVNRLKRGLFFLGVATATALLPGCATTRGRLENLQSRDSEARMEAVIETERSRLGAKKAIPLLISIIQRDDNLEVRRAAVRALGKIGSKDRNRTTKILCDVLFETDPVLRRSGLAALGELKPFPTGAFPSIISKLADEDELVREMAQGTLLEYAPYCKFALKNALINDSDPKIRSMAAETLGNIGDEGRFALNDLRSALRDSDSGVRRSAADAIRKIDPEARMSF